MQRYRQLLVICFCIAAIAFTSCLGPAPESLTGDSQGASEDSEVTSVESSSERSEEADDAETASNTEISREERAKIADLAYLSGRANTSPVEERVVLLSFKHDIDRLVVEDVLYDYLDVHGGFKSDVSYVETIVELRDRYGLTAQQISLLLMDYKAWLRLNRSPL